MKAQKMAGYPDNFELPSVRLRVSTATLDPFGRRFGDGMTSTVVEYMRSSGFTIYGTDPQGLGGAFGLELKVSAGIVVSALKATVGAVRWVARTVRKKQQSKLNERLPLVWIQFEARHEGGVLPLRDAGLLSGIVAILPALLKHLEENFPNRRFTFGGVSNWYQSALDEFHTRRIGFEIQGRHISPGRLLRMVEHLDKNLAHSAVHVTVRQDYQWLPPRVKIEKAAPLTA